MAWYERSNGCEGWIGRQRRLWQVFNIHVGKMQ